MKVLRFVLALVICGSTGAAAQVVSTGYQLVPVDGLTAVQRADVRADGQYYVVYVEHTTPIIGRYNPAQDTVFPYARKIGPESGDNILAVADLVDMSTHGVFFLEPSQQTIFRALDGNGDDNALDMQGDLPEVLALYDPGSYVGLSVLARENATHFWFAAGSRLYRQDAVSFAPASLQARGFAPVAGVAFAPVTDAPFVADNNAGQGRIWRLLTDQDGDTVLEVSVAGELELWLETSRSIADIAFDADGHLLVAYGDGTVDMFVDANLDGIPETYQGLAQTGQCITGAALTVGADGIRSRYPTGQRLLLVCGTAGSVSYLLGGYAAVDFTGDGRVTLPDMLEFLRLYRQYRQ